MKSQILYSYAALLLLLAQPAFAVDLEQSRGIFGSQLLAQIPKNQLPSQEQGLSPDVERGPRVITNPHPSQTDKVGATEVLDADPSTKESVDDSRTPRTISVPGKKGTKHSVRKNQERKTMAIALGGGGARGAAHIGVLRVLEQEKIPIDYIVGNSMGAIIGGCYAAGVPLAQLETMGMNGSLRKAYLPGVTSRILLMPFTKIKETFKKSYAGLWSGEKFEKYLDSMLPKDVSPIEDLKIPFSAVATNLKDGNAYRLSEGKLSTAIRASASIAPLLKPVKIGDNLYVDGGMRANLPASAAKDTDADIVIAVLVDEPMRELPNEAFYKYKAITNRMADVILGVADEHQLQFADIIINPDVSGISVLSQDPNDTAKAIKAGEAAARKAIPAIRKKMALPEDSRIVGQPIPLQ